jgi:ornithine cyclodeaminase/alanine dehydrogenase-like protein (mu-crystallin family)
MQLDQHHATSGTLVLTGADVRVILRMPDCIEAVELAFRLLGEGRAARPVVASLKAAEGGYHIKSALMALGGREYFVSKTNANYPANASRYGLPTIQGTIVVHDASNGAPLAVMDSVEVTAMRTAAATAVAARHLAREEAAALAIVGCGIQGLQHVRALGLVRPLRSVRLYDADESAARKLGSLVAAETDVPVHITSSIRDVVTGADLIVTCTTSREFLLHASDIPPGAFVAGVGVDAEHKRELSPDLLRASRVVVDVLEQCAAFGDLHHAIEAGTTSAADVHAELGAIVAGLKPGRTSPGETFVFDSTGMALQDAATAVVVLERARAKRLGIEVQFAPERSN